MSDALTTLSDALAGFGITLQEKTRLAFGAPVAKALANVPVGGKVFVWCSGSSDTHLALVDGIVETTPDLAPFVASIDATDTDYSKVRPHVSTFLKTRKASFALSSPVKNDDGANVGFAVTRKA